MRTGLGAEVIDLPRDDKSVVELLPGVDLKLGSDIHVRSALEHLGVDGVGDDGLVFAGEVFVQQFREALAGDIDFVRGGFGIGHWVSPLLKCRLDCGMECAHVIVAHR